MDYDEHVLKEIENDTASEFDASAAQEISLIVLGILGMAANCLLIYLICRFSQLQTTTNTYLINWAIASIGTTLSSITCFDTVILGLKAPFNILLVFYDLEVVLALVVLIFMVLLSVEWCISTHLPRYLDKFTKYSSIIIAGVWIFATIYFIVGAVTSGVESDHFYTFFIVLFAILVILVAGLHIMRFIQKCKGVFQYNSITPLLIPTVFVLCWILGWISLWAVLYLEVYIVEIAWITDPPIFLHPIVNLAMLIALDEDIRKCFFEVTGSCGLLKSKVENRQGTNLNSEEA